LTCIQPQNSKTPHYNKLQQKMKTNKMILSAALGLGAACLSNAATIYMTGSTAMRSTVYNAIIAPGVIFTGAPMYTVYEGGSAGNNAGNGGNYMAFVGTATAGNGGGSLTIKCHWSGSEAGVHDVASGLSETFIADSAINNADNGTNEPASTETMVVDLAMADNAQTFSQYSVRRGFPNVPTNNEVGIITFTFVRNPGNWTGSNITASMFRQAEGGFCPLAVFTGNAADTNSFVYISGRDNGSGTRVNTFGDTGYGIFNSPNQIEVDSSGNMILLPPPVSAYAGDAGFSSGGTLAKTMGANTVGKNDPWQGTTNQGFSVIAYLSRGDADTALGLSPTHATELTYNGVAQSRANVIEGTHTLWGNEYILQRSGASVTAQNVYNSLGPSGGIDSQIGGGTKAIRLIDMHCTRQGPNSDVNHN
jgi:hypothetical protein